MRLVDVNLLIYASFPAFSEHAEARHWLDSQLNGADRVGLPWASLLGFLRIATNRRVVEMPLSMATAWDQVKHWCSADNAWIPQPTERHGEILETLLARPGIRGDLVPDAHLAALAIEHGLILCSTDGDFARFPELRWENPLNPS